VTTERKHGTSAGYQQHRKAGEQPCGNCLWAWRLYSKQLRDEAKERKQLLAEPQGTGQVRRGPRGVHGTEAGLLFHSRSGIAVCPPCLSFACDLEHDAATRYRNRTRRAS